VQQLLDREPGGTAHRPHDNQRIAVTTCSNEASFYTFALNDGVGSDRGSVQQQSSVLHQPRQCQIDLLCRDFERVEESLGKISRRRRTFSDGDPSPFVKNNTISESPSSINPAKILHPSLSDAEV
jgi:hypothetical protein